MNTNRLLTLAACTAGLLAFISNGHAQDMSVSQRVAALKGNIQTAKIILHNYEWIQTTTVTHNGDVVSTKQERCYYGDDGSLQKVELSDEQAQQRQGLLFRRIRQAAKDEMTDYMYSAVALVKNYVPPRSSLIETVKENGNISLQPISESRARVVMQGYYKPGDTYSIEVNLRNNRPVALRVSTYVNDPSDPVTLRAEMGQLDNGATYPENITLNADNEGITIQVHNGGYRRSNE